VSPTGTPIDDNKGTLTFVENSITYGLSQREYPNPKSQQALEHVLAVVGQRIVTNLMLSLMRELAANTIDRSHGSVAGILRKLTLLLPVVVSLYMTAALNKSS
jgi:uncharacterized membrane protein required for colicin V production